MRMLVLPLGLGLSIACAPAPTQVATESMSTDSSLTSSGTADSTAGTSNGTVPSTTGDACPPTPPDGGGYDACPALCGGGGQCYTDGATYAVCTRGCFMACDCWPAPGGGAPVLCSEALLESTSVCVLDCSGGRGCPAGMFCVPDLEICAHPYGEVGSTDATSGGMESSTSMEGTDSGSTSMGSSDSGSSGSSGSSDSGSSGSSDSGSSGSSDSGGMGSSSSGSSTT